MKSIFFSLFLLIILSSCSKSEKEGALELCADSNYLKRGNISKDLKVEVESLIEKDEVYQELYQNENRLDKIIIDKENYLKELANKFLLENPKPIAKKIEEVIDITRDDLTVEEVKKTKIKIKDDHIKDIENWKKNSSIYLFKAANAVNFLKKQRSKNILKRSKIRSNYIKEIFSKKSLKEKSKYKYYLKRFTKCEKEFNKTPSSFLLKWSKE